MKVLIEWNGEVLEVSGEYGEGYKASMNSPAECPRFEIDFITWSPRTKKSGIMVTNLLCNNDKIMEELENLCIEKIAEDEENAEKDEDSGGDR